MRAIITFAILCYLLFNAIESVAAFSGTTETPMCPDPSDCTDAIQTLLYNESVSTVYLSAFSSTNATTTSYITRRLYVNRSDLVLKCDPGVVLWAKRWHFNDTGASLLTVDRQSGFTLDGCTLRMWRQDYRNPNWYHKGEWRHALNLISVRNTIVRNSSLEESGGDGIYVSSDVRIRDESAFSRNILIENVRSINNYRQGISVICADGLIVRDSIFEGTRGTNPQCGVDIEPDVHWQIIRNVSFSNILFRNNSGCQISVSTYALTNTSQTHSVSFENITGIDTPGYGMILNVPHDHLTPDSTILFRRMSIANSAKFGIFGMSANLTHGITFDQVELRNNSYGHRDSISAIALYFDKMRNVVFGTSNSSRMLIVTGHQNNTSTNKERSTSSSSSSSFLQPLKDEVKVSKKRGTLAIYMQGSPKNQPFRTNGTGLTGFLKVEAPTRYDCIVEGPLEVKKHLNLECEAP